MDLTSFMPNMSIIFWGAVIGSVVMVLILWFFVFKKRGDLLCDLFEERSGGDLVLMLSNQQVKIIKRKGEIEKWKILGTRIDPFEPKHKSNLIPYLAKRIDKIYLLRDKNGMIHVMNPILDKETQELVLLPDYRDPLNFIVTEYDERAKIKEEQNKWKEFAPYIGIIAACGITFLAIFYSFQHAEKVTAQIDPAVENAISRIDEAAAKYTGVITRANAIVERQDILDRTSNWTTSVVPVR